jgi:hypothetical protein
MHRRGIEGIRSNEVEPRPEDVIGGDASAPGSLGARTRTWWQAVLAQSRLGMLPQVIRY